jgi:hypothetical protein
MHQIENSSRLERSAEEFYRRILPLEAELVREITVITSDYMRWIGRGHFLVAGVGSVLRCDDSSKAKDIDIAIAGLKYFDEPHKNGRLPIRLVRGAEREFTSTVATYMDELIWHLEQQSYRREQPTKVYSSPPPVPMARLRSADDAIEIIASTDSFSHYGSKSVILRASDCRPVQVHFVFNKNVKEWRAGQRWLDEPKNKCRPDKSPHFYYAVLHERK